MSRYTSQYTGSEIDEAIGRALPNGVIDTALADKAPAGYGLGASSKNVTDWNNEKTNGWVRDSIGTEDKHSPFVGLFSVGLVSDYSSGEDAFQLAFARDQFKKTRTYIKFRAYNSDDKVWGEWEWLNPPMQIGVEYRTTERYQGKPVYVKLVDFGALPNNTTKRVDPIITDFSKLVDMKIMIAVSDSSYHVNMSFGGDTSGTVDNRSWFKLSSGGIVIKTFSDQSANSAIVTIKYTKTTD